MQQFSYTDETDRAYGATGMAIGLMIFDGEDMLYSIDLDRAAAGGEMLELSPDFYFAGNPGASAKSAWNQMLKNYNLGISMILANILCRQLVHRHTSLSDSQVSRLRDIVRQEGLRSCSLDTDEADRLFDKSFSYLTRVFSHRGVQAVAHDFASTLAARRRLSRLDTLELLQSLQLL